MFRSRPLEGVYPYLWLDAKLERVNEEIGRRSDVIGIYPNDQALIRLAGRSIAAICVFLLPPQSLTCCDSIC